MKIAHVHPLSEIDVCRVGWRSGDVFAAPDRYLPC
jgi:hypothetical protein